MKKHQAYYYNGKTSTPIQVEVFVSRQGLQFEFINADGVLVSEKWLHQDINKFEKQNGKLMFYYGDKIPYQVIRLDDITFLEEVESFDQGYKYLKSPYRFFEKVGTLGYIGAVLVVILFGVFINYVLMPFAVTQVANSFPQEYEESLGNQAFLTHLNIYDIDSVKTKHVKEFTSHIDFNTDYDIDVYVVNDEMINAYALPGGKVVIFQGIIDKMEGYEELSALLGHEIGHVQKKHSLKIMMKQYSHQFLLSLFVGNSNDIFNKLGGVASHFSQLSFSRDAEREADEYGLMVLRDNNIDNEGAVKLFEKLEDAHNHEGEENELFEDLQNMTSTHPNTEERIKTMKRSIEESGNNGVDHPELEQIWDKIKD